MMQKFSHTEVVRPEWIDSNGHMNVAFYVVVFDHATDVVFEELDIGNAYRARSGNSCFVAETHTLYEREVRVGERVTVRPRLLGADGKRFHLFHEMYRADDPARVAAQELMCLHVDMRMRRTAEWPADRRAALDDAVRTDAALGLPEGVGRRIRWLERAD